jgi:hypothetical protein
MAEAEAAFGLTVRGSGNLGQSDPENIAPAPTVVATLPVAAD